MLFTCVRLYVCIYLCVYDSIAEVGKLWPGGQIQPAACFCKWIFIGTQPCILYVMYYL